MVKSANKLAIYNREGKETDSIELPEDLFGGNVNKDILHQAILMYQANVRSGHASTKERGAVSGGGKKPWRQKGTGRARQGSIRSPLWHKGGIVFGPHPRDFSYTLPKKIKVAALRESLNAKYLDKDIICLDDLKDKFSKTKEFATLLDKFKLKGQTLAVLDNCDPSVHLVSRNIAFLNHRRAIDVNAYEVLQNKKLLVTRSALKSLIQRIK